MPEESNKGMVALIATFVGEQYLIPSSEIFGVSRSKAVVEARQMVAYLAYDMCGLSYPEIGLALGGRDHTTVMSSVRRFKRNLNTRRVQTACDQVRARLRGQLFHSFKGYEEGLLVPLSEPVKERLMALVESGCFGSSIAEAAERIVSQYVFDNTPEVTLAVKEGF
jgi:hypothetical protein